MKPELHYTTDLFNLHRAWLSPDGKWVIDSAHSREAYHESIAEDILMLHHGYKDVFKFRDREVPFGQDDYEEAEELGWIRLHGYRYQASNSYFILYMDTKLTYHQKQAIRNWCKINNVTWETAVQRH